jgi:hypothetical protein
MAEARGVDGVLCDSVVLLLAPDSLVVVDVSRRQKVISLVGGMPSWI